MSGTKIGGQRAAQVNYEKYGKDYYRRIGAKGGASGTTGGFFANRELARRAGAIGGAKGKRGPKLPVEDYEAALSDLNNIRPPKIFTKLFRRNNG